MGGKRIVRSRNDRLVAGVCSGLAAYINIDPLLVRLGFVILTLMFNVFGVLTYLALWLMLPNEDSVSSDTRTQVKENIGEMQRTADELVERVRGIFSR